MQLAQLVHTTSAHVIKTIVRRFHETAKGLHERQKVEDH